ncbi:formylglycine-generating enzyme family protein [Pontiella sp.]|uniref:formylglycine-generating enzyme family protein n=1 Tax=Pontiella sp. TaxID=2837462 RepID=UPI003562B21D
MSRKRKAVILAAVLVAVGCYADVFGTGTNQFSIDFVLIGNADNSADANGYGAVDYDYRIGRTEVTIDEFAKARAADSLISDGDEGYWNDGTRTVGGGGPASYVSAYEGMKFANWLTTGSAIGGAYQFSGDGLTLLAVDRAAAVSTYGTVYVLPSEDEWYKAAYYKPINDGTYSLFANGSDELGDLTHGTTEGWNYYSSGYVNGFPNYMWEAGFGGPEQNGTYDMMGNVWEWCESAFDGSTNNPVADRVYRGGLATAGYGFLRSTSRNGFNPAADGNEAFGFRVAAIGATPVPAIVVSINIDSAVGIEWSSISGQSYQVQYSTNLVSTNWFDLGGVISATNATGYSVDYSTGVSHRFYRVISD